jgi:PAB-dependent poly(A)-specific ribonuclease subunit 2
MCTANNAMDLVEYGRDDLSKDYAALIQAFSRFLLDRLVSEWSHFPRNPRLLKSASLTAPAAAPITQLMGIHMQTINTCSICSASKERATMSNVVEMVYPRQPGPAFDTLLRDSIIREIGHKATCGTCKRAVPFSSRRSFAARDLPPVLVVHACVTSPDQLAMWRDQRKTSFLGPRVTIRGFKEGTEVEEDEVTYAVRVRPEPFIFIYRPLTVLQSLVVQVITEKQSHLVSIVKGRQNLGFSLVRRV